MRWCDPVKEREFFDIFQPYYDLEQNTSRSYPTGQYSLERMGPLAALAGHPERQLRIIHVAGTKGKGSTCFFTGALLQSAGRRCAVYSSPHLATVRERFLLDGRLISYDLLLRHSREFEKAVREAGLDPKPTLFEILTVLALQVFAAEGCEYVVMETGIGGLLDATNYVPSPVCCAITPVSFDHMELLGDTIEAIAGQKAGIIKPGVPTVVGRQPFRTAGRLIRSTAASQRAPVFGPVGGRIAACWQTAGLARFLQDNFRVALRICSVLGVRPDPAHYAPPMLPARCERLRQQPLVIIDAAHNADSAQQLVASLGALYPGVRFTVVLGIVKGKDVAGIFGALAPFAEELILTNPQSRGKGSELDGLVSLAVGAGVRFRVQSEITSVDDLPRQANLLFTGSFFTALIGEKLFGPCPEAPA